MISLVTAVAGVGRFVWNKVEARFDKVTEGLDHIESELVECRQRSNDKVVVIELLWQVVQEYVPATNPVLSRAKQLLAALTEEK